MKLGELFSSTRRAEAGTPVGSREEVLNALMGLNRPTAPYQLVDGRAEGVDVIAEWKIVDAQWYELFAKASISKVFRIYLKLDPDFRSHKTSKISGDWAVCLGVDEKPGKPGIYCPRCPSFHLMRWSNDRQTLLCEECGWEMDMDWDLFRKRMREVDFTISFQDLMRNESEWGCAYWDDVMEWIFMKWGIDKL